MLGGKKAGGERRGWRLRRGQGGRRERGELPHVPPHSPSGPFLLFALSHLGRVRRLIAYLTIILRARVGYELALTISQPTSATEREWINCFIKNAQKNCSFLSSPAVFVVVYRLRYLCSIGYELIYHCLLTNQNSGKAISHG